MNAYVKTRNDLLNIMRCELMGPGSECREVSDALLVEHEVISELPESRYSVGVLYPQDNQLELDDDEVAKEAGILDETEIVAVPDDEHSSARNSAQYIEPIVDDIDAPSLDESISLSSQNLPSSMGFTFFVSGDFNELHFKVDFALYRNTLVPDCVIPFRMPEGFVIPFDAMRWVEYDEEAYMLKLKCGINRKELLSFKQSSAADSPEAQVLVDALYRLAGIIQTGFVRIPYSYDICVAFADAAPSSILYFLHGDKVSIESSDEAIAKLVVVRRKMKDATWSVTAMLVNIQHGHYKGTNSIFQPKMTIFSSDNIDFVESKGGLNTRSDDIEEKSLELIYRDKEVYAAGHGVSVDWEIVDGGGKVWTEFMPTAEVPPMSFDIDELSKNTLSMKLLSDLHANTPEEKIASMSLLVAKYREWIDKLKDISLAPHFHKTAERHIVLCEEAHGRMVDGLELLKINKNAYSAFVLANRAMFMQRVHLEFQKEDRYPGDDVLQTTLQELSYYQIEDKYHWRPFQLAFILMSIRSIVDHENPERNLIDLIWFPTGGGKTEAYLGLTAFTIFYRRLTHPNKSDGTAVIMRYTLRLLTTQQFLRAGTLICACEYIRDDSLKTKRYPCYPLGDKPITIGLWVGGGHTPNKNKSGSRQNKGADEYLKELTKEPKSAFDLRNAKDRYNKFSLLKCPWCGTKLVKDDVDKKIVGIWGYRMEKGHFRFVCRQVGCHFELGLPAQVVDDELYANPPTLLFATVDKFAMLPWKNEMGSFFATGNSNRTPELIIQDELHLISGPLGTMVGHYEVVIDELCSAKGIRPKIIASTATIRRAGDQCAYLYNREVRQFPASGIDADDSFFAKVDKAKPGRLYIGVSPAGKTKAVMQIRAMSAFLQRVHMLDLPDEIKDAFWTLTGYFNSLRDLGSCSTRVDDDIKDHMRRIIQRFGNRNAGRTIGEADELTSRVTTSILNETLHKLERVTYSKGNLDAKRYPSNVLLATNMISVGLDIARLNVMFLIGQPKSTSEYIQASSRIGRTYPGMAFVLFDASKSRDRSHYEQFKAYHDSFYRYVEPTSVTPFSKPARDRALHAVLISLMRHKYGLSEDNTAGMFDLSIDKIEEIENIVINRICAVNEKASVRLNDESEFIRDEMREIWREWHEKAQLSKENLCYGHKFMMTPPSGDQRRLIKQFGKAEQDVAFETLTSLRNVDSSVTAGIIVW